MFSVLVNPMNYKYQLYSQKPGGILESFLPFESNSLAHPVDSCSRTHVIFTNFFPFPLCMLIAQLCLTLCNIMNWGLPGSSVHWIFQARILPFFSPGQKYCHFFSSELPFLSPGDLPDPGVKHGSPTLQAVSLPSEPLGKITSSTTATLLKVTTIHLLP